MIKFLFRNVVMEIRVDLTDKLQDLNGSWSFMGQVANHETNELLDAIGKGFMVLVDLFMDKDGIK